jgi:flagellar biosynthesis GTPase FlhF
MWEMKEERQVALIVSSVLDEALGDIRLQYEAHAEDLAKRVENARGVLDAAAAQERRASEADASLRARSAALEAERKALDERARSAQEFEATIRWRIEVLDRNQRKQDARSREQAQRAQELEEQAQALEEQARLLDQRESTLAAHERTATEAEASLRLREEAATERDQTTLAAKASAARRVEELRLREEACWERDAALAERKAEVNRHEVATRRLRVMPRNSRIEFQAECALKSPSRTGRGTQTTMLTFRSTSYKHHKSLT